MKLLSIDTETTGLDPARHGILEIGAVLFDPAPNIQGGTETARRWQTFECLIDNNQITGDPHALHMNAKILGEIAGVVPTLREKYTAAQAPLRFREWLRRQGIDEENKVTVVGKNYCAFDEKLLCQLPGWRTHVTSMCERRVLDVGSLCFEPADGRVASLSECLKKLGTPNDVAHRALDDALQVATAVTRFFS